MNRSQAIGHSPRSHDSNQREKKWHIAYMVGRERQKFVDVVMAYRIEMYCQSVRETDLAQFCG